MVREETKKLIYDLFASRDEHFTLKEEEINSLREFFEDDVPLPPS